MRHWLLRIGVGKIALYAALVFAGRVQPFAGDNANSYFMPIGHRIATEGKFNDINTRDDNSVPPGYPFVLAAMERVGLGHALWVTVCLQYAADLVVALLLLSMGTAMGSAWAGFAAGLAWLFYPPAVVIASWIAPESIFTAFLVAAIACVCMGNGKRAIWGGLWFGIAALFRADCLFLPIFFTMWWLWKRAYRTAILFSLIFGVTVGLWTLRNYLVVDDVVVVSSSFGSAFMQGSDERFYHDKEREYPPLFAMAAAKGLPKPVVEKSSSINRWLFQLGIRHYQDQARDNGWPSVAGMVARKFVKMWYLTESGNRRSQIILLICAIFAAPLGLIELGTWFKLADQGRLFCALTVAYWILIHILIVPIARYTVPVFPVILLAACFRLERIWKRTATPQTTKAASGA